MESATLDRTGSSAVDDTIDAEREREEARLAAEQADLDKEPSQDPPAGAGDEDQPEAAIGDPELVLDGQLSFSGIGGKQPLSATVTLTGGKVSLPQGQLKKGQDIVLRVVARVHEVAFSDQIDPKTKQPVSCERRHKARIIDVSQLEEEPDAA